MTSSVAKAAGVSELEIDGDFLVFDGDHLHRLTGSASEVWRSIHGSTEVEEVVRRVQSLHQGDHQVAADVRSFIDGLVIEGLLEEELRPSNHFAVPPHVAWCSDGDRSVIIADLRSGERFQLSTVASDIWSLTVVDLASPDTVSAVLAENYPDAPDDLDGVIAGLHESLLESGLLERGP